MKLHIKTISILLFNLVLVGCQNNKCVGIQHESDSVSNASVEKIDYHKSRIDSVNKSLDWKQTNFDLWKSKNGDLAIKTEEGNEQDFKITRYITQLCCEGAAIKNVIDTLTFTYLGSSFYKDKNHVYTHFMMSDGGNFWIVEGADTKTFEVIGNSCYAKDKNYIYGERAMKMDHIDYQTFRTCDACGCFAKDKNGYYFWNEMIDLKDIDGEIKEKIESM